MAAAFEPGAHPRLLPPLQELTDPFCPPVGYKRCTFNVEPWKRRLFFLCRASGRLTRDQRVFVTRMEKLLRLVNNGDDPRLWRAADPQAAIAVVSFGGRATLPAWKWCRDF